MPGHAAAARLRARAGGCLPGSALPASAMRVLLGISGGIAAYKTPELVRELRRGGAEVRCVLTPAAGKLVAPAALAAVSGAAVHDSLWTTDGRMPHIDLARWAERVVVAPATADCLARAALGLGDDLLATLLLALDDRIPLWFAPAMNATMWGKASVQAHLVTLVERGAAIIDPVAGELACGESGIGAMADPAAIARAVLA